MTVILVNGSGTIRNAYGKRYVEFTNGRKTGFFHRWGRKTVEPLMEQNLSVY